MSAAFWNAFSAGLAAPVMLFGETPGYSVNLPSPAQNMAKVGGYLNRAVAVRRQVSNGD